MICLRTDLYIKTVQLSCNSIYSITYQVDCNLLHLLICVTWQYSCVEKSIIPVEVFTTVY